MGLYNIDVCISPYHVFTCGDLSDSATPGITWRQRDTQLNLGNQRLNDSRDLTNTHRKNSSNLETGTSLVM
jgi:hypothetical protein